MSSVASVATTRSNAAPAAAQPAPVPQTQNTPNTGAMQNVATPAVSLAPDNRSGSGSGVSAEQKPKSLWERGTKWLGDTVDAGIEFSEGLLWKALEEFAPDLVPIIKQGPMEWLKEKISTAVNSVFDTVMAPVRAISDVALVLRGHFAKLMEWMTDAAAKIAKGDCKPIAEAAEKISQVFEGIAAPIVDRIKNMADRVRGFFSDLWGRFGAPAWDFLKRVGGQAWDKIQQLGKLIWDKTAPIREKIGKAWTWIKNKLGIGEGPEGQDGILQWVKSKAALVWDQHIKPFVEKHKKPLMVVAGILALMSPAGPFIAVGAAVAGLVAGINWIKGKLAKRGSAAEDRGVLEKTILPAISNAVDKVSSFLTAKVRSVTETIGKAVNGLGTAVSAVAGSVFKFAVSAFQWLMDRFQELVAWAREKLGGLVTWVKSGLLRLKAFVQPLLNFLKQVGRVAIDIMTFPAFVAGALWKLIPACIRDPFVDFLINQVLKRIPILKDVIEVVPKVWAKVKTTALTLIRMVFKEGNLKGALFEIFKLVLGALDIPIDLIKSIIAKAGAAKDLILANPLGFLGNLLSAVKQGFIQFGEKILTHLGKSIADWFRFVLKSAGLTPPTEFTIKGVFEFLLQVLGITLEKILARIEEKIGKEAAAKIRKTMSVISKVWEWLSTLINEGPSGVWNKLKENLGDLWGMLLDSAIGWVTATVAKIALPRITVALGTAPVGAVIEAIILIYKIIQTAAQYAKRILEMVSSVLDAVTAIAKGAIAGAADRVEQNLGNALTVAIGFLANYLGLGDLGKKIKEIVEGIQKKVEKAVDWVIDKALAIGKSVIDALTRGVKSLMQWWNATKPVEGINGEKHTLLIKGEKSNAKLIIQSDPVPYRTFISNLKTKKDKKAALKIADKVDEAISNAAKIDAPPDAGEKVEKSLADLAIATSPLLDGTKIGSTPPVFGPLVGGFGSSATVLRLTRDHDKGGKPSVDSGPYWDSLRKRLDGKGTYYVRGHLLNHNLGGPGNTWDNLTPLTQFANNRAEDSMLNTFETPVKEASEKGNAINFVVTVDYGRNHPLASKVAKFKNSKDPEEKLVGNIIEAEQYVPLSLRCKGSSIDADGKIGSVIAQVTVENIIQDRIEDYHLIKDAKEEINVNTATVDDLQRLYGIDKAKATAIASKRGSYKEFGDVIKAGNLTDQEWKAARETPRIRVVL